MNKNYLYNKIKVITLILLLTGLSLTTQAQWTRISSPSFEAVTFVDANIGYGIRDGGTIFKTTDGGTNWSKQNSGTTDDLRAVYFIDANTGYVATSNRSILKTTDGGANWSTQASGMTGSISAIDFVDANTGYAVGSAPGATMFDPSVGMILKTTDGGKNWASQTPGVNETLNAVSFVDANTGYTIGRDGTILKTTDGGANWTDQTSSSGTTNDLKGIAVIDANTVYVVGDGSVITKTTDGGTNWNAQTVPAAGGASLRDIAFLDANTGYTVGENGVILKTTDGGTNWTAQTSGTTSFLNNVTIFDANTLYAIGSSVIFKTTDAGANWTGRNKPSSTLALAFTDENTGYGAAGPTIWKTTNGGLDWTANSSGTTQQLEDITFTDENTGYVVGRNGVLLKTTNGGDNWNALSPGTSQQLLAIAFTDANTGYITGSGGTIIKTTDAGANWTAQTSGVSNWINDILFVDANTGYALTSDKILKTTDGGANWTTQDPGISSLDLYAITATDANTVYAAGANGVIIKTTDGGANWTTQTSGTTHEIGDIVFVDANTGYAVSDRFIEGVILSTTDGGANWSSQTTDFGFSSIAFVGTNTGYAVGTSGTVFKYTTPEINLKQGSTDIASGGEYNFGEIGASNSSADISFTIENIGEGNLTFSGSPVVLGGTNADQFSITQSSLSSPISGGSSQNFTAKFSPTSVGEKTATLTITSNDSDEGTYTINLKGTATEETVTSLSGLENEAILVYPNPTQDKIIVESLPLGKSVFTMLDILGNEILNGETEVSLELDLSPLPTGVYQLKLNTSKGVFTKKIIKQ